MSCDISPSLSYFTQYDSLLLAIHSDMEFWLTHLIFERGIIPGYGNDTP